MKTLLFFSLLIAGTAFSQSKKDLIAQVASYKQRLDSMNLALEKTQHLNDSLSNEIKQKEQALKDKQATLDYRTKELEILNVQIENLKSSKKEDPTPAPKLPKIAKPQDNPFGNYDRDRLERDHSLGKDDGDGRGRYLINKPDVSAISSEESCKIVFQVIVDENGRILGTPEVIRASTTTSDQVLIKKVSATVKSQAKYNPAKKGTANMKMIIPILINPN